jgi:quinol-cytochrome oxidoreductase complex cytochrome b subunit
MKKPEINPKIAQLLNDFDNMEKVEPSPEWHQNLMHQIMDTQQGAGTRLPMPYWTVIGVFLMLNSICVFNILKNTHHQSLNRMATLQLISKELLIHSVTVNP